MRVLAVDCDQLLARVAYGQGEQDVTIATLDQEIAPGDWVLVYLGMAVSKLTEREAADIIAFYEHGRVPPIGGTGDEKD